MSNKIYQIVPNTIPRLVQVVNNEFFDGDGNPLVFQGPQGPLATPDYKYQTSSYLITSDDYFVEAVGTFDINLPTAIGAAGKTYLIKNSGTGEITINPTASQLIDNLPTYGLAFYDTLVITSNGTNWSVENPQTKAFIRVYNDTGSIIPKGSAVRLIDSYFGIPSVSLAIASGGGNQQVVGLAFIDIPIAAEGLVLSHGILEGIDLSDYSIGDILYLSDTVSGGLVNSVSALSYSSRTNKIGYVTSNDANLGTLQVFINNEHITTSLTEIETNILLGNVISTGTYDFLGLGTNSNTTFNVSPVKGWIVQNTGSYSTVPNVTHLTYAGATAVSALNISSQTSTFVLLGPTGSLVLQNTFPTPQQRRENIYLGKAIHPAGVIQNVNNSVDFDVSPVSMIRDLWTPIKLIHEGILVSAHSTNMEINVSSGTIWGNGIGWTTNQLNPNSVAFPGQSPTTFQYRTRLGATATSGATPTTFTNRTIILPDLWDNNGALQSIGTPNAQSTNQRVYAFSTGLVRIQFGQKVYSSLSAATTAAITESFVEFSNNRDNGILIGIISLQRNTSDLSSSTAVFTPTSKFGEVAGGAAGGLSTTTLQQAYDNSSQPEILTDSTRGAVSFRRGSTNESDHVLEIQSSAGSNTFYVTGDGHTTTQTLTIPNIGLTSGATRYMVVDTSGNTYYQTTNGLPDGDPIRFLGGATAFSFGSPTISVWGNLIPSQNYTYDLGSTSSRWNNLYVKDVFAASQSIYLGDLKLTNVNGQLYVNGSVITGGGTGSGTQGPQGFQGITGPQGSGGGSTGSQGSTGPQGFQGDTGAQGFTGNQGETGPQGFQGFDGPQGLEGTQGFQGDMGPQGLEGTQGFQGSTGPKGDDGQSSNRFLFSATYSITGDPGPGYLLWNSATQIGATQINISHIDSISVDIDVLLSLIKIQDTLIIQDRDDSNNYQKFTVDNQITIISNSYVEVPVIFATSSGTGTSNFSNGQQLALFLFSAGVAGPQGSQGNTGPQGFQGLQGDTGPQGFQGLQGPQGFQGVQGLQGYTGPQGQPGTSTSFFNYLASTASQTGYPGLGNIIWNNTTQISATAINVAHLTNDSVDIDIILATLYVGQLLVIQDADVSGNYQKWFISGTSTNFNPNTNTSYWEYPVTISTYSGTFSFFDGQPIVLATIAQSSEGPQGVQGPTGSQGPQGPEGFLGPTGPTNPAMNLFLFYNY